MVDTYDLMEIKVRRTRTVPVAVRDCLELANLLPGNIGLPPLTSKSAEAPAGWGGGIAKWCVDAKWDLLNVVDSIRGEVLAQASSEDIAVEVIQRFEAYIWNGARPNFWDEPSNENEIALAWTFTREALERYEDVAELRFKLDTWVQWCERHPLWSDQFSGKRAEQPSRQQLLAGGDPDRGPKFNPFIPIVGNIRFSVGPDGIISPVTDAFSALLIGLKNSSGNAHLLELMRVRKCRECGRFFWAGRVDKFSCSVSCTQKQNDSIRRANTPAELRRERWREYQREYRATKRERELRQLGKGGRAGR